MENKTLTGDRVVGSHFIVDLFGCNRQQINSESFLRKALRESIKGTDIEILNDSFYKFEPQGITCFMLLSTSHISAHSWPEYEYISIDFYSCSDRDTTRTAVQSIIDTISHTKCIMKEIDRTYSMLPDPKDVSSILKLPVYKDGSIQEIHVTKRVENIKSNFQKIEVIDTAEFGRCLVIDDLVQTSEKDHYLYDEAILAGLSKDDKEIIILGGGDGYVAQKALEINPNLKITVIDLDAEVVAIAKKHLGQKVFDHPNVTLYIGDALQYLRTRTGEKVDGIVSDLTDNPMIELDSTFESDYRRFFNEVLTLAKANMRDGGWIGLQAGTATVTSQYFNSSKVMGEMVATHFHDITKQNVLIPSFGEENCFILAKK